MNIEEINQMTPQAIWEYNKGINLTEEDVKLAKEYCENHTFVYGNECEPIWCKECNHLKLYEETS